MQSKMLVRNRMSVNALKGSENDSLKFINNPKTGKVFFMCGTKQGYISPAVQKEINTIEASELQYAECCIEGQDAWVPCIMKQSTENVVRTL